VLLLLLAAPSLARRFAVPLQPVTASRPEEPSAPEESGRVPEIPRAAARMALSAEGRPWYWVYECLEIRRVRAQMAISRPAVTLDLHGSEAALGRCRSRAGMREPAAWRGWAAMALIRYRLVALKAKPNQAHPTKRLTHPSIAPTRRK